MRTEVRIIEVKPNGPAEKILGRGSWWRAPVLYVLEDGREISSTTGQYSTKRAATEGQSKTRGDEFFATFTDDRFTGTKSVHRLTGRNPVAAFDSAGVRP